MKQTIAFYVALEEERYRMTLEALAEVDAKRTIEQADIEAWVDRLAKPKPVRGR